jgi:YVTN family beta-propeller protein
MHSLRSLRPAAGQMPVLLPVLLAALCALSVLSMLSAPGCTLAALPGDEVTSLGNGMLIVLNKSDDSATLLDALTGDRLMELPTGPAPHEVAVSPDGTTAVVANYGGQSSPNNTLTVIDLAKSRVTGTIGLGEHSRPHGIQFTRDGRQVVVTAEGSGSVLLVDLPARRVLRAVPTGQAISHMVVLGPDGRLAYVTNIGSGSLSVLDVSGGRSVATIPTGAGAEGLDISPDGRELWVANRDADTLSVIDTARLEVVAELPCAGVPIRLKFTPDGGRVLVSNAAAGDVAVFDVAARRELARIPMGLTPIESTDGRLFARGGFTGSPVPVGLLVSRDGTRAWVANTNADIITVLDLQKLEVAARMKAGREPDGLGFTPVKPAGT